MRANEFNIDDKIIDKEDNMVIEILDMFDSGKIKYKCLDKGKYKGSDINVGKTYTSELIGCRWEKLSESIPNIPAKAIQEMRDKISENEKNLADMKKTLEKMEIQNKGSFKVGDMISFVLEGDEYRGIAMEKPTEENIYKILLSDDSGKYFLIPTDEDITNIKILNSKKQKEMAEMVLDFYNGKIPE